MWDNTVSVIDTSNNTVIATIPVGEFPAGIVVHPNGTCVYVANRNDNTVSVIDTGNNTEIAIISVGNCSEFIAWGSQPIPPEPEESP